MTRTVLDRQLQDLSEQLLHMWALSDQAFEKGLEALQRRDPSLCQAAISYKPLIEATYADIEERAFSVLSLQQPLGGRDLRFVTAVPAIAAEVDRIGEGGVEAARLFMQLLSLSEHPANRDQAAFSVAGGTEAGAMADLLELGKEARRVLEATLKAFAARDAHSATLIWQGNTIISQRYEQVQDELIDLLTKMRTIPELLNDEGSPRRIAYLLLLAQQLALIADYCNSICERTVFIAEGITKVALVRAS
jgi:phosphate transport system protein